MIYFAKNEYIIYVCKICCWEQKYYIFVDLGNPQAAQRISDGIKKAEALAEYLERHPMVRDELLSRLGIRTTYFYNYSIFYIYNEEEDVVYIIRVLYNKTDWKSILGR